MAYGFCKVEFCTPELIVVSMSWVNVLTVLHMTNLLVAVMKQLSKHFTSQPWQYKTRSQHWELHALLYAISVCIL